jgi:outer membrane biosynthesis protein TonB
MTKTKVEGGVANKGAASVDAKRTPIGVYTKQVFDIIGSRWNIYVKNRGDLIAIGVCTVRVRISAEGRVLEAKVISNSSNDRFAEICLRSIRESELTPPPPDVMTLRDGVLQIDLPFTLF